MINNQTHLYAYKGLVGRISKQRSSLFVTKPCISLKSLAALPIGKSSPDQGPRLQAKRKLIAYIFLYNVLFGWKY